MSLEVYLAYLLACALVAVVPGPTVALIVANSLTHGARAGLLNVAGTQLALALMLGVLVVGLAGIMATMGWWFDWLRLAGALYLVWLGWRLLRTSGELGAPGRAPAPRPSASCRISEPARCASPLIRIPSFRKPADTFRNAVLDAVLNGGTDAGRGRDQDRLRQGASPEGFHDPGTVDLHRPRT